METEHPGKIINETGFKGSFMQVGKKGLKDFLQMAPGPTLRKLLDRIAQHTCKSIQATAGQNILSATLAKGWGVVGNCP